jgi:uncharacterized protein (TIGR02118 family)
VIKRVGFGWRRDGMSRDAFEDHYVQVHGPLASRIPGLRRYVLNFPDHVLGASPGDWDAFAELWFDDQGAMEAGFAALADELGTDRAHFLSEVRNVVVREVVVFSGTTGTDPGKKES